MRAGTSKSEYGICRGGLLAEEGALLGLWVGAEVGLELVEDERWAVAAGDGAGSTVNCGGKLSMGGGGQAKSRKNAVSLLISTSKKC